MVYKLLPATTVNTSHYQLLPLLQSLHVSRLRREDLTQLEDEWLGYPFEALGALLEHCCSFLHDRFWGGGMKLERPIIPFLPDKPGDDREPAIPHNSLLFSFNC